MTVKNTHKDLLVDINFGRLNNIIKLERDNSFSGFFIL